MRDEGGTRDVGSRRLARQRGTGDGGGCDAGVRDMGLPACCPHLGVPWFAFPHHCHCGNPLVAPPSSLLPPRTSHVRRPRFAVSPVPRPTSPSEAMAYHVPSPSLVPHPPRPSHKPCRYIAPSARSYSPYPGLPRSPQIIRP